MDREYCPCCMGRVEPGAPCAACGPAAGAYAPSPHHLPPGAVLRGRYLVGRVLGEGGFGITYIGRDLRLERKVAIKEYFPIDRANRVSAASPEVSSYAGAAGERYEAGKARFLQEAQAMARMDKQPVIVGVRDFFELNNTAYIVMEYVEGTTLQDLAARRGGRIPAGELLRVIEPLFPALGAMHRQGLIHRDISPENLMLEDGKVRLLDFGCTRESAGGEATVTIALKHSYAPVEQYQNRGQGPWTDVYALSATIYYCLTGRKPPQSLDRLVEDELVPPRELGADLTQRQERALLYGMGVRPRRRFQSMEELRAALYGDAPSEGSAPPNPPAAGGLERAQEPAPGPVPGRTARRKARRPIIAGAAVAAAVIIALLIWRPWAGGTPTVDAPGPAQTAGGIDAPAQTAGYSMTADSAVALRALLDSEDVGAITVPSGTYLRVEAPAALTKTLRIEADAAVEFAKGLTVAEGGRVQAWGQVEAFVLLRTVDGGTVSVESGGSVLTQMLWLEREGDLTCAAGGSADVFGGSSNPTRDTLSEWALTHYLALDEEELFADAVHVAAEEEFSIYHRAGRPIVVDGEITLSESHCATVPILISEGAVLNAPGDEDSGAVLELDGSVLVNRGVLRGRANLAVRGGGWREAPALINYGRVEACLGADTVSAILNLGEIEYLGPVSEHGLDGTSVSNLGSFTVGGGLTMRGNWSNNAGNITVAGDGSLLLRGGLNNYGEVTVEDGGRLEGSAVMFHNSGSILVRSGGALHNLGVMQAGAGVTVEAGAEFVNEGVLNCVKDALKPAQGALVSEGHLVSGILSEDWQESGVRARWVGSESELRAALADDGVDLVFWNLPWGAAALRDGPLAINKGVVVSGGHVDFDTGGLTVSGENAFLAGSGGCRMDFRGNAVTVEEGGTVLLDVASGSSSNLSGSRLEISSGGMVCFGDDTAIEGGEIALSGGGRLIHANGLALHGCTLRVGQDSGLRANGWLGLTDCGVDNAGSIRCLAGEVGREGMSLTGNPIETD